MSICWFENREQREENEEENHQTWNDSHGWQVTTGYLVVNCYSSISTVRKTRKLLKMQNNVPFCHGFDWSWSYS